MNHSIAFHQECLKNLKRFIEGLRRHLQEAQARIDAADAKADFLERQIAHAQTRGLTEFDADKFIANKRHE